MAELTLEAILSGVERYFDPKFQEIERRFESLEARFDAKLDELETRFDGKLIALEKRIDTKLEALRVEFDAKLNGAVHSILQGMQAMYDEQLLRHERDNRILQDRLHSHELRLIQLERGLSA